MELSHMRIRKEDERMMKKRIKTGGALILAVVLAISTFVLPNAFAADEVKTTKDCTLTVNVANKGLTELISGSITVNLYKVADIAATGKYTELVGFEGVGLDSVNSETTTAQWEEMSAKAATRVTSITEPYASLSTTNGVATFNLKPGMYLVVAQQMLTDYYQYDFTPYLISLPDNRFYQTNDDTWLYDIQVSLKPAKTDRVGDLIIKKTLDVYNATLGEANFVFQVEAEKTDVDEPYATTKVYSNVVSLSFDNVGTKQIKIDDIPAGAVVTVTEVYSGASYKFVSADIKESAEEGKLVIIADGEEKIAEIDFDNTYDENALNGGNGLVNEFTYSTESGWDHEAKPDSISAPLE